MERCRDGYGFSKEDKEIVRRYSNGKSAFSDNEHNYTVHHITACYIGKLAGIPKETISDPFLNAIMLTDEEAEEHDKQERYEIACLEYEVKGGTIYEGKIYKNHERTSDVLHFNRVGRRNTQQKKRRLRQEGRPTFKSKSKRGHRRSRLHR